MNQPSALPTNKVSAGLAMGSLVSVGVFAAETLFGVSVPGELSAAMTTILGFVAAYFVQNKA